MPWYRPTAEFLTKIHASLGEKNSFLPGEAKSNKKSSITEQMIGGNRRPRSYFEEQGVMIKKRVGQISGLGRNSSCRSVKGGIRSHEASREKFYDLLDDKPDSLTGTQVHCLSASSS